MAGGLAEFVGTLDVSDMPLETRRPDGMVRM
jgi:hypothetical protein